MLNRAPILSKGQPQIVYWPGVAPFELVSASRSDQCTIGKLIESFGFLES